MEKYKITVKNALARSSLKMRSQGPVHEKISGAVFAPFYLNFCAWKAERVPSQCAAAAQRAAGFLRGAEQEPAACATEGHLCSLWVA